jgi:DNA uptake protein ComE-like DNA-binding protein
MLRRKIVGLVMLGLLGAAALNAQVKELPRTPVKSINEPRMVDINSAPESEFMAVGIAQTVAKKIVDGRPYRSKRDLVTRQLLTQEQYDKFKNSLVAKRPKK